MRRFRHLLRHLPFRPAWATITLVEGKQHLHLQHSKEHNQLCQAAIFHDSGRVSQL